MWFYQHHPKRCKRNVLLANQSKTSDMTAFTSRLLSEQLLWERLALRSRQAAARKFTWARVFSKMQADLEVILPTRDTIDYKEAA